LVAWYHRGVVRPLAGRRLLLVVEDATLAELLAEAASRLGAEVDLQATGRGALAALQARPAPQAAIVDLPVSDLGGGELIGAARASGVPVIGISGVARGPQAAGEVLRLGAADFFEKPFPVLTLMARAARLMGAALPGLEAPEDEVTAAVPLGAPGAPGQPIDDGPFLALALDEEPGPSPTPPVPWLAAPLPAGAPAPPPRASPQSAAPGRRGELARTSLPRLLVALHQAQATGALTVARGPVRKLIVVEKGAPVYAASNVGAERFGAICVRRRLVAAEELERLRGGDPEPRTGDLLEKAGRLGRPDRIALVGAQVRAIAWSMFEWDEGRYHFQLARPPPGLLPLGLSMAGLLLEGMVRAASLPRLVIDLPAEVHLAPAPAPAFEPQALGLGPGQAHLFSLCDGTKSVLDLVALSRLPERESLALLQALRVMRVLDDVDRILAGTSRIGFM
jgi:CheY-like chemotaxis protein